jgi:hypothetical protein
MFPLRSSIVLGIAAANVLMGGGEVEQFHEPELPMLLVKS